MEAFGSLFLPELAAVALLNGEHDYFRANFLPKLTKNIGHKKVLKKIQNSILKTIDEVYEGRANKDQYIRAVQVAEILHKREVSQKEGGKLLGSSLQYDLYEKFMKDLQKSLGKKVRISDLTSRQIQPDETRRSVYQEQFMAILDGLEQKVDQPKDLQRFVEGVSEEFQVRFGEEQDKQMLALYLNHNEYLVPTEDIKSVQQALAYLIRMQVSLEQELAKVAGDQEKVARLERTRTILEELKQNVIKSTEFRRFVERGVLQFRRELIDRYPVDQYKLVQPCLALPRLDVVHLAAPTILKASNLLKLRSIEGLDTGVARATETFLKSCVQHITDSQSSLEGFDWAAEVAEIFKAPKQVAAESPKEKDDRSDDNGENGEAESDDEGESSEAESNDDGEVGGEVDGAGGDVDGEVKPQSKPESRIQAPSQAAVEASPVQPQVSAAPPHIPSPTTMSPDLPSSTSATTSTDSTNTSTNSGSSTVSSFPWLYAGIGTCILLVLVIAAIFIFRKLRRSQSASTQVVPMQYVSGTADKAPADMLPPPQYSVAEKTPKS